MFGFLKKKKKNGETPEKSNPESQDNSSADVEPAQSKSTKKKGFPIKLVIIIVLVLIALGASGFVVYRFWFSAKPEGEATAVYKPIELAHVTLPDEMLKFSFEHFPQLYAAFIAFDKEMTLFTREIERIEQIATAYPEQEKIAQKEKKTWEKARQNLKKAFIKIEKPIKETYVLFRVNKEMGLVQIKEKNAELTQAAQAALDPAREMTGKLIPEEVIPEGLINGTIYKIKKKFL